MTVIEYKKLLGTMYRQDYSNDQLIGTLLIEVGRAINRLLEENKISPFDEYEKVKDIIEKDTKWRQSDGTYKKST
ncbi:hypothetical protein BUZ34_03025 [Staphylococcus haemolyticus]|uniref:hypothetical protein n=2 Tax=Staphylococcus TaxID=1279 RepID=UPI000D1E5E5E|nr:MULTISPECIES: hypothetical protein [Staphylococcus]MWF62688.1 hypothetical protein [Staphylococcus haemolyticus]PTK72354.1 hypothetical protein BUZ26_00080 [Staphylococcus haemolyticus]PTK76128.1 hypothetical protein BUZ24_04885 [Staphylococcus haemolyticus]PTK77161.1 hypothetical protein BUZ27_06195 [Staphylococcus haemolyticus]PTK82034.1 hypothetical protein BUZ25_02285 [Staphylococcus haemolyticus]